MCCQRLSCFESTSALASKLLFACGVHLWFQERKTDNTFSMLHFKLTIWQARFYSSQFSLSHSVEEKCQPLLLSPLDTVQMFGKYRNRNRNETKKKPSKISFAWMKNRVYNYHCCKKVNAYFIFSLVWNKMNPNKQKHWCFELISVLLKVTIIRTNSNKAKSGNIKQISFNPIKISLSLRMLEFDLFKWILI